MKSEQSKQAVEPSRVTRHGHRFFSEEFKASVVDKCLVPGASVSAIALAHGFNTNLVRNWIQKRQAQSAAPSTAARLVPVMVTETAEPALASEPTAPRSNAVGPAIEIELGEVKVLLRGPVPAAQLRLVLQVLAERR
jgi:transposase-like protein